MKTSYIQHLTTITCPRRSRGQVMVEAIVALSALTLGFLAILALLNQSLGSLATVSDRNIATYLAAEGIEIARNLSDAAARNGAFADDFHPSSKSFEVSWDTLLEPDSDPDNFNPGLELRNQAPQPLLFDDQNGYNYQSGKQTRFTRVLTVSVISAAASDPYFIKVKSTVAWTGKGGLKDEVAMADFFFNWK